jgi:hypothetical protein
MIAQAIQASLFAMATATTTRQLERQSPCKAGAVHTWGGVLRDV